MSDLPALLLASLDPHTRKEAESKLTSYSLQNGFLPHLLALVLDSSQNHGVRLAGSVFFKNVIKKRWSEDSEETPILVDDKILIRAQLVPAMISLSSPTNKALRAQIAESVSVVASHDFPERWPDLIDQLVGSLTTTDYSVSLGVLETAHSIFRGWRSAIRSDELYTVINYVLSRFVEPYVAFFRHTAALLLSEPNLPNATFVSQAQVVLMTIYYDLTCQDLPPLLEDNHVEFFGVPDSTTPGWFLQFLAWDPPALRGDPDDITPSIPSQLKTVIMEIAELYTNRFPELFTSGASIGPFVQTVWSSIGDGKRPSVADDTFVAQSLRFISTAIKSGLFKDLFGNKDTIKTLVNGIVVPNVELRDHETEQFEDDPMEYIRIDLSVPATAGGTSTEGTTRRHAAADVLRALVGAGSEAQTTEFVFAWVNEDLQAYKINPRENWKRKDRAIFLLTAIASRGATMQQGVTSTSALVKIVDWFAENVFEDLQAEPGTVHPILQVDAIRYLHTFRNQLTKEQLLQVLPLLVAHLRSDNYVCYSYAAITVERILFIKQNKRMMFTETDIHDFANDILTALFDKVESGGTPEKVSENDYLMKCVMRVIITARQSLIPVYQQVLNRLVTILSVICKNPSNPSFDQFLFESIASLIRFTVAGNRDTLPHFEAILHNVCTVILQQDIEQFVPYTFQILSQMLELHTGEVPAGYRSLLPLLLVPAPWAQKGSIPGLVRYLKASLECDGQEIARSNQFAPMLGIAQQRLIPSKINDGWGFDLLQAIVKNIPFAQLSSYFPAIIMSLLTRLQTNKTDKFSNLFTYFIMFTLAIRVEGLTPDILIAVVENIQTGLWTNLFSNILLPEIPKISPKDRKAAVVGLTLLLTQSLSMRQGNNRAVWSAAFIALAGMFLVPQALVKESTQEDADTAFTQVDIEEQSAGYQAAYSRLAASETPPTDPIANIPNPHAYLGQELTRAAREDSNVKGLIGESTPQDAAKGLLDSLAQIGYAI